MTTSKPNGKSEQDKKGRSGSDFAVRVKTALLRQGKTITDLARKLKLSRNGVSRAINHPVLPTVRRRIEKELAI